MSSLRPIIRAHRPLIAVLLAMTLTLRMLVPSGFMPDVSAGKLTIEICTGYGPMKMVVALPRQAGDHHDRSHHDKAPTTCAFAGVTVPGLGATDPIQFALAIAFILAIAQIFAPFVRRGGTRRYPPPVRGPPLTA